MSILTCEPSKPRAGTEVVVLTALEASSILGVTSKLTIEAFHQPKPPPALPSLQHSAASGGVPQQA